jgi:hypothetical protein
MAPPLSYPFRNFETATRGSVRPWPVLAQLADARRRRVALAPTGLEGGEQHDVTEDIEIVVHGRVS